MYRMLLKATAFGLTLAATSQVLAAPPQGVRPSPPNRPPAPVTPRVQPVPKMAPQPNAIIRRPSVAQATPRLDPKLAKGASFLGNLNAAHASTKALEHASPTSTVGAIAAYKTSTLNAQTSLKQYAGLVSQDQAAVTLAQSTLDAANSANPPVQAEIDRARADLIAAQQKLAADQAQITAAEQAITDAQAALSNSTNKELTPDAIAKLNQLLGI
ncbi:MAG: hypothetical protein RJA87_2288 [Pseudomonadota bacterium]